ncbi:hypothetical protein C8Q74DRAFT_1372320 [Fomes fomentarius]|nr:hypothetical protein C8Q74DRAFT_1372320 [Fomes fomentarius]
MANQPPSCRTAINIFVSGYLLDEEMLKHLCLLKYGATEAEVDDLGPVDFASLYYAERNFLDAPWLVPISYRSKTNPKVIESGWLIPGKAAFFRPGAEPPQLPYDAETRAYLDTWFPRDLFKRPEFKGVRFVETHWPRDIPPVGIVLGNLKMAANKEARAGHMRRQQRWVDYRRSHGQPDTKLPAPFPVSWHL